MNFTDFLKANKPEWFNLDHGHAIIARAIDTAATCKQDALILAPPRCGKSTIFADLLPRWLTEVCKAESVIVACGSPDIAGHWRKRFDAIASEGAKRRVYFVGAGAALCGRGADVFILDTQSFETTQLADWYASTVRTRLKPDGYVLTVDSRSGKGNFTSHLMRDGVATTHIMRYTLPRTYAVNVQVSDKHPLDMMEPCSDGESNWSNLTKALKPYLSEHLSLYFKYPPLDDMSKLELVSYHDSTETGDYLLTLKFKSPYTPPVGATPLN